MVTMATHSRNKHQKSSISLETCLASYKTCFVSDRLDFCRLQTLVQGGDRGGGKWGRGSLPRSMREISKTIPYTAVVVRYGRWFYTRGTNRTGFCFGNFWVSDSCWAVGGGCTANLYSRLCRFPSLLATCSVSRLYSQAICVREVVAHEWKARSNLFPRGRVTVVGQTTRVSRLIYLSDFTWVTDQ